MPHVYFCFMRWHLLWGTKCARWASSKKRFKKHQKGAVFLLILLSWMKTNSERALRNWCCSWDKKDVCSSKNLHFTDFLFFTLLVLFQPILQIRKHFMIILSHFYLNKKSLFFFSASNILKIYNLLLICRHIFVLCLLYEK